MAKYLRKNRNLELSNEELKLRMNELLSENSKLNRKLTSSSNNPDKNLAALEQEIESLLAQNHNLRSKTSQIPNLEADLQAKAMMVDELNRKVRLRTSDLDKKVEALNVKQ